MPPEYCGGLGDKGAEALKDFVAQGGTLILFNHASDYATQFLGVKAKNVLRGVATKDFYSPGSLLNVSLDTKSPLAYGMPAEITIWSEQSPGWDAQEGRTVARYPGGTCSLRDGCSARNIWPENPRCSMCTSGRGTRSCSGCARNIAGRVIRISN